ncbi:uncharacterized protein UMAG_10871 [Mycosarcoma maydis]|uniref:DUF2237 domain-containing protein n=1 Tax=Mycosarcoma maydis TaxID=5270 RepID=A0A0D1E883_MYCMD|nr:uncharacterized protein UMAG_10871 [Ustilago maydis 521]KIS70595.1 hypothetical protein UMAG_10871 [Ustilago maydis 521]|eukprot:XP_011388002.1 hypothetical protein UMAG_10871 [Ustilago maydis 521]
MDRPLNVFGRPLGQCGTDPVTGFYRDGYCNTGPADGGSHTVAAVVSRKWLEFSASKGNDLRPILSEGCSWCLCVSRWKQSLDAYRRGELPKEGVPKVKLEATHQRALDVVSLEDLKGFALDDAGGRSAAQDPALGGPIR